ncbi:hypothetical protein [Mycoplasma nasistruthionis]|uniref:Uncharacterized protein n=1 Tax=Mycoplasma nasistruthionis TaxID=353852 RepID=A0A4Y6I704_9MOLU|nr:hypothetical protein [Mycoplasma nasistruthionis]QDF64979.1 hypothetical protein FIV53_01505 [Mycoplasma nasistruthionis]
MKKTVKIMLVFATFGLIATSAGLGGYFIYQAKNSAKSADLNNQNNLNNSTDPNKENRKILLNANEKQPEISPISNNEINPDDPVNKFLKKEVPEKKVLNLADETKPVSKPSVQDDTNRLKRLTFNSNPVNKRVINDSPETSENAMPVAKPRGDDVDITEIHPGPILEEDEIVQPDPNTHILNNISNNIDRFELNGISAEFIESNINSDMSTSQEYNQKMLKIDQNARVLWKSAQAIAFARSNLYRLNPYTDDLFAKEEIWYKKMLTNIAEDNYAQISSRLQDHVQQRVEKLHSLLKDSFNKFYDIENYILQNVVTGNQLSEEIMQKARDYAMKFGGDLMVKYASLGGWVITPNNAEEYAIKIHQLCFEIRNIFQEADTKLQQLVEWIGNQLDLYKNNITNNTSKVELTQTKVLGFLNLKSIENRLKQQINSDSAMFNSLSENQGIDQDTQRLVIKYLTSKYQNLQENIKEFYNNYKKNIESNNTEVDELWSTFLSQLNLVTLRPNLENSYEFLSNAINATDAFTNKLNELFSNKTNATIDIFVSV